MDIGHNFFFYPNACHTCKKFGHEISLKRCGNCKMISYCSKEHQKEHWPQHKEVCNAICRVLKRNEVFILRNGEDIDMEEWTELKMNFMLMVALQMGRRLVHYEEEMFKFLRSCSVCHDRNTQVLENCPNCPNTSFCPKHKAKGSYHKFCDLMKLCFDLDVIAVTQKRNIPKMKVPCHTNYVDLPQNIKDFIDQYIAPETDSQVSKEEDAIISSEYLTRPLSFLYALQKLGYSLQGNSITVHIIAANMIDIVGMVLWEILLHWLPCIATIDILLIGPELLADSLSINLCRDCKNSNRKLSIEMFDMFYDSYVESEFYKKPDFIIGYNAGIHECEDSECEHDTWMQSVQKMAEQNCSLILTSYTCPEAKREHCRLKKILGSHVKYTHFERNPYSSIRPYRDFETEGIYYQNQYIIIYKDLRASS